jgi:hypothetical protein
MASARIEPVAATSSSSSVAPWKTADGTLGRLGPAQLTSQAARRASAGCSGRRRDDPREAGQESTMPPGARTEARGAFCALMANPFGALYSLSYDVLNDFEPISLLASFPSVLFARKTLPANDLNELIA